MTCGGRAERMGSDHRRRLRCLVVGNEEGLAEGVAQMLESMGHSVARVWSGQEAISRFSAARFDLVMIDGQERREAARAIKDTAPSTWVILTTGNPSLFEADGVDVIMHKPFSKDDLVRALRTFMRRNAPDQKR